MGLEEVLLYPKYTALTAQDAYDEADRTNGGTFRQPFPLWLQLGSAFGKKAGY